MAAASPSALIAPSLARREKAAVGPSLSSCKAARAERSSETRGVELALQSR